MSVVTVLTALEEDKKRLQQILQTLYEQAQQQRLIFSEGTPEEIERFSRNKKDLAVRLQGVMNHIQKMSSQHPGDEKKVSALLETIKKESRSIVRMIVEQEKQDEPFLLAMRQEISGELHDLEKARSRLKRVKTSYVAGYGNEPEVFDREG